MLKYADSKWVQVRPNRVVTHGSTEPVLTVLDVRGFEVRDLFLIGLNADCGSIIVDSESRARNVEAALEPAYAVMVKPYCDGDWVADYTRRDLDGSERDRFFKTIVLKGGRVVMRDGRRVSDGGDR